MPWRLLVLKDFTTLIHFHFHYQMLQERNLIYFDPFYFPNGQSAAQPKYFVVLKVDNDDVILGALPTRRDSVPTEFDSDSGCIQMNEPGNKWTCYRILPTDDILENGEYPFYQATHIYAWNIDDYQIGYFSIYPIPGVDYEIVGVIKQNVFDQLITCFAKSPAIKQKHKKRLNIKVLTIASSPKAEEEEE